MAPKDANARETMLAVVSNAYGSPDVLEYKQLPKPTPLDGEVLLQVHAAGIHAGTPLIAAGIPWVMRLALGGLRAPPPDSIAGTEVAGKVVAIGSNVKTLKVGDAVFGEIDAFGVVAGPHAQLDVAAEGAEGGRSKDAFG